MHSNLSNLTPASRFVSLHSHSTFSVGDGLGYPADHINFVLSEEQGMDAWCLTDHGNGSGLAHAHSHASKMQKKGRKFRQLNGVEFYFVPSLKQWQIDYDAHRQSIKDAKTEKQKEKLILLPTDIDADDDIEQGGHVVEDEEESKNQVSSTDEWKRRYHLVVFAKNAEGLGNLFTLVKKSYKHGFYRYPRIDFEMLKEHGKGLIVSTACLAGNLSSIVMRGVSEGLPDSAIQKVLLNQTDRFVDCVGLDNFFLELQFNKLEQQHAVNRQLLALSAQSGIKLISTADSHYPSPDKWQARELLKRLARPHFAKDAGFTLPKFEDLKCELYPKNAQQMWDEFCKHYDSHSFYEGNEQIVKDSIERTHDIVWNQCEDVWVDTKVKLPNFDNPEKTGFQQLCDLVKAAIIKEGLSENQVYIDRVKEEMSDIKFLGHSAYFLTMYKIFQLAEKKTLFGAARGSAAGSLVCYLLGITQIDPIPTKLLWSRFLGRHRVSFPDIDSDAGDRDVLIDSAKELFGNDAVIPVSNFNTLKLKSLVKDISKFYNVPFEEVNALTGPLQDEVMPHAKDDDQEKSVFVLTHDDCMKYSAKYLDFMTKYPDVANHLKTLFFENRSIGRHAGGVIIAPAEIIEKTIPLVGVRGELQTPWTEGMNFRNLEDNGFLKFDFLGLTLMKDVENCIRRILVKQGNKNPTFSDVKIFFDKNLSCRYNAQDDQKVWDTCYHNKNFVPGLFQFTAAGSRNFCVEANPNTIEELAAITAIYRPGPLKANVHIKYTKAKQNASEIVYAHPIIEEILGPTAGFVVFQEQFMSLANRLGGFTMAESDQLRKTLVKKSIDTLDKKGGEKETAKRKFIEGAQRLHGVSSDVTEPLWQTIDNMSVYCFNKSHSLAYAIDSYYSAWLATYYPMDWFSTCLQSESGSPDGLAKAITEIKALGYKFASFSVNHSGSEWEFSDAVNAFIPPLTSLKGVGDAALPEILQNRPYKSVDDLLFDSAGNWRHSKMNKTCFNALCRVEAFGELEELQSGKIANHKQLLAILADDENYKILKKGRYGLTESATKRAIKNNVRLEPVLDKLIDDYSSLEDWTRSEKLNSQFELSSNVDPTIVFPEELMVKIRAASLSSIAKIPASTSGIGWFCILDVIEKKTKTGKDYLRVKWGDNESNSGWMMLWGAKYKIEPFTIWVAEAKNDPQWGFSSSMFKMKKVDVEKL